VLGFEDKVPRTPERISLLRLLFGGSGVTEGATVGTGMSNMLTTALVESGRFIVVERENFDDIIKEQKLGASGLVKDVTASKIGDLVGAQVLIRGAVTEFQESTSGGAGGIGFGDFGIGIKTAEAHVAIDLKMFDAATGVILEAKNVEKKIEESGLALAAKVHGISFGGGGFQKTPIGKAVRECIQEAVNYIILKMDGMPWQGRIVKTIDDKIYINAGEETNMKAGDILAVYNLGEELIDPETGLSLGSEETKTGAIKIEKVEKKFSICSVVEGGGFTSGSIIKLR
jgi:curli biogenesis system outer membrane secretion channel CsgG